ncbi:NgoFVII restriction endonuclease [Ruminiclostridium hungatei]|uniref:NgoFVII restriction endonuclease n=1 Tax=Ruminiclostridium hungatei TaxID=48256 RepID=A0A1V4SR68_RUMHU|nr:NgoFVII restriction endonuclease [Ruminiclostridium hungatei]
MVEYSSLHSYNKNCVTGDSDHLYKRLKESILKANKIDIIVAFLMESGVRLLEEDFKEAVDKGTVLRILCGNYLNITQPQALYLLKDTLGDKIDLRFYNVPNKSFHPKAYIFEYENSSEIYIGSSNVSRSALTSGIEWNYRISSETNPEDCSHFKDTFEDLFLNQSIIVDDNEMRKYSKRWKRPKLFEDLERIEDGEQDDRGLIKSKTAELLPDYAVDTHEREQCLILDYPRPIGPQIEALYELKKSRLEGAGIKA